MVLLEPVSALWTLLQQALQEVMSYPFDPARRVYWLSLLSSALLALLWVWWRDKKWQPMQWLRACCDRDFWYQRTHLVDIALMFTNAFLRLLLLAPLVGAHLLLTITVARGWQATLGDPPELVWHGVFIAALYTLVFFVVEDGSRFLLHRTMHRVPWLWAIHRVHHSATALTPLTLFRVHPIEMLLYFARSVLVFGVVSGSFIYLFSRQLSGFDILGVDALGMLFNLIGANLRHSPIWLGFGRAERWFISPAQHQIHHSSAPEHVDRNFGTCLAVWDRLTDSWLPSSSERVEHVGLMTEPEPTPRQAQVFPVNT